MNNAAVIKSVKTQEEKKKDAIRKIQEYFLTLSRAGMEIPALKIDGIYGDETRSAVKTFQALIGIPVTGIVDIVTWDILYSEYVSALEMSEKSKGIFPFEEVFSDGAVKASEKGNIVYILQIMLETVADYYEEAVEQIINGVFDEATVNNLREFQKSFGLEPTGVLDKMTWNALATVYNNYLSRE